MMGEEIAGKIQNQNQASEWSILLCNQSLSKSIDANGLIKPNSI
jgi:hypothetical protein